MVSRSFSYTLTEQAENAERKAATSKRRPTAPSRHATDDDLFFKIGEATGAELNALDQRIKALEARDWGGVWEAGKSYAKSSIISHAGSAWIATRQYPEGAPGMNNSGWKLFVKRGRDGKR